MSRAAPVARGLGGLILGGGLSFGFLYGVAGLALEPGVAALWTAVVVGALAGIYTALAFARSVYARSLLCGLGLALDLSWSLLNTVAALLVWLPACALRGGGAVAPDALSRRSGTFVYARNPRGGGYVATTVGPVIAGGWLVHEEIHVWQARIFGPLYLPTYLLGWLLGFAARAVVGPRDDLAGAAYRRIPWEDWAYAASDDEAGRVDWGAWWRGFFVSLAHVAGWIGLAAGVALGQPVLWAAAAVALAGYALWRARR